MSDDLTQSNCKIGQNRIYNDIRYNSKIRYIVNLVCTKINGSSIVFYFILQENICFVYLLESHREATLTNTQNV